MNILVLSDLHVGQKAITKELYPYPDKYDFKDESLVDSSIEIIKEYIDNHGIIDYLIIPGDITNKSNLIEYKTATTFLEKLISEISISKANIIFVPGNHDVDWSVIEGIPETEIPHRVKHKYNTLNDTDHMYSELSLDLTKYPYLKKCEYEDVVFFGYNSSWHDDATKKNHYGLIDIEHIDKLREEFLKIDEAKLKFFVVHHHLLSLENPHKKWIDISAMQNAEPLLNLLSEFSFDFVIHGHRHVPYFSPQKVENYKTINVFCSGSYSCEIPTAIAGKVGNLFHIIEIDSHASDSLGRIKTYAYDRVDGWQTSTDRYGIEFINPFGNVKDLTQIVSDVKKLINLKFIDKPFLRYSSIEKEIDDLKYLPSNSQKKLLEIIATDLKYELTSNSNSIILIKR